MGAMSVAIPSMLILLFAFGTVSSQDYCSAALCGTAKHIACGNNGAFVQPACGNSATVIDLTPYISQILDIHNSKRSIVGLGQVSHLKSASRLATVKYNPELASLALLNVKQCAMKHDACRNTPQFKSSGQNLFYLSTKPRAAAIATALNQMGNSWYNENADTTQAYIDKYPSVTPPKTIGHFTAMLRDSQTDVGCSAVQVLSSDGWYSIYIACNYATTNIIGVPVYRSGPTASLCQTGKNPKYPGLCSESEKFNV